MKDYTLLDCLTVGMLSNETFDIIKEHVGKSLGFLVTGDIGVGKTTLLRAIYREGYDTLAPQWPLNSPEIEWYEMKTANNARYFFAGILTSQDRRFVGSTLQTVPGDGSLPTTLSRLNRLITPLDDYVHLDIPYRFLVLQMDNFVLREIVHVELYTEDFDTTTLYQNGQRKTTRKCYTSTDLTKHWERLPSR